MTRLNGIVSMISFHISTGQIDGDRNYQEDYLETDTINDTTSLLILADGMGGYEGGKLASTTVTRTFKSSFDKSNPDIKSALHKALMDANNALQREKDKNPNLSMMGTTFLAVYIHKDFIQWISVGDSPLWLISSRYDKRYNKQTIQRINKNHSIAGLLELQLQHGEITKEEMNASPNKHMLTSAVTGDELNTIDLSEKVKIYKGDILILASDGVETLRENEILNIVLDSSSIETSADMILDAIKSKNKSNQDNSSLIVIANKEYLSDTGNNKSTEGNYTISQKKNKKSTFLPNDTHDLINLILLLLIIMLLLFLYLISGEETKDSTETVPQSSIIRTQSDLNNSNISTRNTTSNVIISKQAEASKSDDANINTNN